jgi:DNA end-binding protein Ku
MAKKKCVGICKTALREGREHLAAIRVDGDKLVLTMLRWPAEIRQVHFNALDEVSVSAPMKRMAEQLVDSMVKPFDPLEYTDEWGLAMNELIEAKANGKALVPLATKVASATSSLEEALMASLATGSKKKKAS